MDAQTHFPTGHADSSGTETAGAKVPKTRRSHTKSRNGCVECKSRHIRCDERRPLCANCEAAERTCSFPSLRVGKEKQQQRQRQRQLQWRQYQPKEDHRSEARVAASPHSEVGTRIIVDEIDNADASMEYEDMPQPALDQQINHSEVGQAPDQSSNRPSTRHETSPSIPSIGKIPHSRRTPVPSSQLDDLHGVPANCCPGLSGAAGTMSTATFTPQHLILLRNADRVPNFHGSNGSAVDIALRHAVDSPYLIDEILAFTAFHMTKLYPGSGVYLRQLATELQTRALASFNRLTENLPYDDKITAVPRFLFSAILGRHMLADTLVHYSSNFHLFIDRFVECLVVNRGVRAVSPPARDFLYNSEIQPFLKIILDAEKNVKSPGSECDALSRLMDDSDLSESSAEACRQAIRVLQRSFDICTVLHAEDYPQTASIFLVGIGVGFVDMLHKSRPEALIVLAYYGVLLHRCRSFWAYGDAGGPLTRAIARHLGNYWQEALAWPLQMLETESSLGSSDMTRRRDVDATLSHTTS